MAPTDPLAKARFSRFVKRVLDEAYDRGLSQEEIEKATGVRASTYHRWARAEVVPTLGKVRAFCAGLGVPVGPALLALGITEGRDDPEPEPVIDPEVARILRILRDPNVTDEEKRAIRAMLAVIGARSRRTRT
jgi:transcriptional regulator with XRE-family HTH domain